MLSKQAKFRSNSVDRELLPKKAQSRGLAKRPLHGLSGAGTGGCPRCPGRQDRQERQRYSLSLRAQRRERGRPTLTRSRRGARSQAGNALKTCAREWPRGWACLPRALDPCTTPTRPRPGRACAARAVRPRRAAAAAGPGHLSPTDWHNPARRADPRRARPQLVPASVPYTLVRGARSTSPRRGPTAACGQARDPNAGSQESPLVSCSITVVPYLELLHFFSDNKGKG